MSELDEALRDVLACPVCGGQLARHDETVRCGCGAAFAIVEGVLDFVADFIGHPGADAEGVDPSDP